jgi:cold-inducible RNA-binding protein
MQPGVKLYVGNLVYSVKEADLRAIFSEFGELESVEVVRYKKSGRSKGFGYVRFENPAHAQNAINTLNGTKLQGRALQLELAQSDDPPTNIKRELSELYVKWAEKDASKGKLSQAGVVGIGLKAGSEDAALVQNHTPLDHQLPDPSHELPMASHQLPEASHELPQASHQLPLASHELPQASHELEQPTHDLPLASHELPQASHELEQPTHELVEPSHELAAQVSNQFSTDQLSGTVEIGQASPGKAGTIFSSRQVLE